MKNRWHALARKHPGLERADDSDGARPGVQPPMGVQLGVSLQGALLLLPLHSRNVLPCRLRPTAWGHPVSPAYLRAHPLPLIAW